MHILTVKKTDIWSELRMEIWTFYSPRKDSTTTYLSVTYCCVCHQNITYLLTVDIYRAAQLVE